MTKPKLIEAIEGLASNLGMTSSETEKAIKKHQADLRSYYRKLRDRYSAANKKLEAEHRKREIGQWRVLADAKLNEEKERAYKEKQQQRNRMPLGSRVQSALAVIELKDSRAPTTSFNDSGRGGETSKPPPGFGDRPLIDCEQEKLLILRLTEKMERKVDEYTGLLPPSQLSANERDALLKSLAGVHSTEVAKNFPELGSQRWVEEQRKRLGKQEGLEVSPSTGLPKKVTEELHAQAD